MRVKQKAILPLKFSKTYPVKIEPNELPRAENTTINPDIELCLSLGKEDRIMELSVGYIGAKKKPIKGNKYRTKGALFHEIDSFWGFFEMDNRKSMVMATITKQNVKK